VVVEAVAHLGLRPHVARADELAQRAALERAELAGPLTAHAQRAAGGEAVAVVVHAVAHLRRAADRADAHDGARDALPGAVAARAAAAVLADGRPERR